MPTVRWPRHGSLAVWHRKRAKRPYARIRSWPASKEAKLLGFAGYKVGMTHAFIADNRKNSMTKGEEVSLPVSIIECPPIKIAALQLYKRSAYGLKLANTLFFKADKELGRKISLPKKADEKAVDSIKPEDYDVLRVLAYTQPKLTGIGKKKPELFEIGIGGKAQEQLDYARSIIGKEVKVSDLFTAGEILDFHGVTIGKGLQGVVKRYGVKIRSHKAEKTKRGAVIGAEGFAKVRFSAPQAGQMGYHPRVEHNKLLVQIGEKPEAVNVKGGFVRFGFVKNTYILVRGSVQGPSNRIIRFKKAMRPNKKKLWQDIQVTSISTRSQQGR